jgi:hypothetical protein
MTDTTSSLSPTTGQEAKYDAIKDQLRELDREAREACYQLLVLLVQSRDKATDLSAEWGRISHELSPSDRKEVSSLLLGSGGVFFHDDNIDFALNFNYNKANNVYNVSVDFDAEPGSSCYRKCPHNSKLTTRERSQLPTGPSPNSATNHHALGSAPAAMGIRPQSFAAGSPIPTENKDVDGSLDRRTPEPPKPSSRTANMSPRSSPLSTPGSSHNDGGSPFVPRSPLSNPEPARSKRRSRAPAGRLKQRRVADNGNTEYNVKICKQCDPPRIIKDKTYFKRHVRLEHGEDRGKAYLCPIKVSGSLCNRAIKDICNFRRHLVNDHKMERPDSNKLVHSLEMVLVEGI